MDTNDRITVSLIRESCDDRECPLVDVVSVPASIRGASQDATLGNVLALMRRISADFAGTDLGRLATDGGKSPMRPVDFLNIPAEFLDRYGVSVQPVDTAMSMTISMDEELAEPEPDNPRGRQHRRICVQRYGYAIVPGDTDKAAMAYAKENLGCDDFDWEPVTPDLVADGTVMETCGPNGESLPAPIRDDGEIDADEPVEETDAILDMVEKALVGAGYVAVYGSADSLTVRNESGGTGYTIRIQEEMP